MTRLEQTKQLFDAELERIKTKPGYWQEVLTNISEFYKLTFPESLLLTTQSKKAKTVGTLKQWNKYNRNIRIGEHGTAVFTARTDTTLKYLYDISQTYGKPIYSRWNLSRDVEKRRLLSRYNEKYDTNHQDVLDIIKELAGDALEELDGDISAVIAEHNPTFSEKTFRRLTKASMMWIVTARCGYKIEDNKLYDFSLITTVVPPALLAELGNLAVKAAGNVLLEIEHAIRRNNYVSESRVRDTVQKSNSQTNRNRSTDIHGSVYTRPESAERTQRNVDSGSTGARLDERAAPDGAGYVQHERADGSDIRGDSGQGERTVHADTDDDEEAPAEESDLGGESASSGEHSAGSRPSAVRADARAGGNNLTGSASRDEFERAGSVAAPVTAEFEYNGRHFVPVGKMTEDYDDAIKHTRSNYDRERNAYLFDGKPWEYQWSTFSAAAKTKADVFRCIENGKIYIPGENELFEYTGKYSALEEGEENSSSSLFVEGQAFVKILSSTDKRLPTGSVYDFADANELFKKADLEQRTNRELPEYNGEWCGKVRYGIYMRCDGEDYEFSARYDTGDGDGTLLEHLETLGAIFYNTRIVSDEAKASIDEADNYRKDLVPMLKEFVGENTEAVSENADMLSSAITENDQGAPEILWGEEDSDGWFTESELLGDFVEEHGDISFALANKMTEYLDEKQHIEREMPEQNSGWYKKTFFRISANISGDEWSYLVREDIGDGDGSVIDHIKQFNQGIIDSDRYPYNSPEEKKQARQVLNILVPYLEKNTELSADEQRIFDDFKKAHPIAGAEKDSDPQDEPEEVKQKFEQEISTEQDNIQSEELFDTTEIEEHISDNMQFKEVAQVNDNEIYWITQGIFSLSELQEFQQAVRDYGGAAKKFYVTYRGISPSYSFEDDMENKVLAVVTPDEIFSDDYIKAIENAGLEAYLYSENEDTAELERAKQLINEFTQQEYGDEADFTNLHNVDIAYTTTEDSEESPIQVSADLINHTIVYQLDGETYKTEQYNSLKDMNENGLTGLDFGELVAVPDIVDKQTEPTITCEWSESAAFEDGKTYSVREFDEIMAEADKEYVTKKKAGIEKYGSWEQLYESDDEEYVRFLGYDKVKFTVNMPDGSKITERQDIGDGYGGVIDFLRKFGYKEAAATLENAAYGEENKISLHRVGDFYEIYGEQARQTAEILDIRLTKKRGEDMCGFPAKALDDYRAKLENAGYTMRAVDDNDSAETTQLSLFDNDIRETEKKDEPEYTTVVINAFGGAGAGKTTACLHITAELKKRGYVAEFVPEYAKELVWEKKYDLLNGEEENQKNLLIEMQKRIDRVVGNCDFAITDSPLLLNGVYLKNAKDKDAYWNDLINEINKYNNFNFVVQRDASKFEQAGRIHTLEQSIEIDGQIENLLREKNMEFSKYDHSHLDEVIDNAIQMLERLQKQNVQPAIEEKPQEKAPITANFHLSPGESINYAKGAKAKYADNVSAIRTLKLIEREKRTATPEEQQILAKYLGWGGLSDAFDERKENWHKEYIELKTLLSDAEYKSAFYSTNSAFYTDPELIRPIWTTLQRFGFKGGEILEPSMGTGNFFSVIPPEIAENSHLHGIELDSISGRIAKLLYPDAEIKINGYQNVYIDDNSIDLAIGNVPFEQLTIEDDRYERRFLIHDYFFVKTIDKLKPGGIAAFITSTGTLDKTNSYSRWAMAEKADLIGAVRLPDNAFKAIAGTETATDIIFFQKREQERIIDWQSEQNEPSLLCLGSQWVGKLRGVVNNYFSEHQDMLLAEGKFESGRYGSTMSWKPKENTDLYRELNGALNKLNAEFTALPTVPEIEAEEEDTSVIRIDAPDDAENFSYYIHEDGELYYRENEYLVKFSGQKKTEERIKAMCSLRDKLSAVISAQLAGNDLDAVKRAQQEMSDEYDKFAKKYGFLNAAPNASAFREDTKSALLLALERETADGSFVKADIFTKMTISVVAEKVTAETAQDALIISLNMHGAVNIPYMAKLLSTTEDDVVAQLGDAIFFDPAKFAWVTAEEYLSGNVVSKLETAQMWAQEKPEEYERNVAALQSVQPARIGIEDIDFNMGQPYIPKDMYAEFCKEKFGYEPNSIFCSVEIGYNDVMNSWKVTNQSFSFYDDRISSVYGTKRATAWELLEKSLNQIRVTIKDPYVAAGLNGQEVTKYKINDEETKIARARQRKIESEFKEWVLSDDQRVKIIEDNYNDKYNRLRQRVYNGEYIRVNGLAQDISLRPHQLNAVAKIAAGGCVMLAHEVGAGKTATMATAGMYLRQIGAIKKPLYVVPKPIIAQWGREFARFFPTAKILITGEKDFEKKNRRRFLGKIATGDYDAVVMSQNQFESIPLSISRQIVYLEEKKADIEAAKMEIRQAEGKSGFSVKALAAMSKKLDKKLDKLKAEKKKDNFINFESLGCDYIFVDEAHKYKNLGVETRHNNVAGLNASTVSERAFDMETKVKYLQEINGGGGVTFATGTPLSNSISECFVFQHFLQPKLLAEANVDKFDKWAHVFSEIDMQFEAKPTGDGYKQRERFSAFKNLFELSAMLSESFDIVKNSEVSEIELPKVKGGKPEMIICEQSFDQAEQVEEAMERAKDVEERRVNPRVDNMLAICTDMTKISLDPRIRNPDAADNECLKVNRCVENVIKINNENPGTTQVIFCDTNVPKDGSFSVYSEIKDKLVKSGKYTADEVRFIHDAKNDKERLAMFDKVNSGEIRVIIGSTEKLGTGVNIQRKLIAAHHLDAPYVPKDVEQRNGRIVRQGNENKEVRLLYYSTKGTFDSYRWQLLEKKQRLISQLMSGKPVSRRCQDIDDVALTYAEMKAATAGNPLIAEKMSVENEIETMKLLKRDFLAKQRDYKRKIETEYPTEILKLQTRIEKLNNDVAVVEKNPLPDDSFAITLNGKEYTERSEAGKQILEEWESYSNSELYENGKASEKIGTFRGLDLYLTTITSGIYAQTVFPAIRLRGELAHEKEFELSAIGICIRLENMAKGLPTHLATANKQLESIEKNLETLKHEYGKPFEQEAKLNAFIDRLDDINEKLAPSGRSANEAAPAAETPAEAR